MTTGESFKDSIPGIVIFGLLTLLWYFARGWQKRIEKDIEERVEQTICLNNTERNIERRKNDDIRFHEMREELIHIRKLLEDHLHGHKE